MKNDNLKQYIALRESLLREKSEIQARLNQINEALGQSPYMTGHGGSFQPTGGGRRGRAASGALTLKQAVLNALARRPMNKQELLEDIQNQGYRFSTNNPANSLGVVLYGKSPRFNNHNGFFSLEGETPSNASTAPASDEKPSRRQMSEEARKRIAEAAKARWKKAKAAGQNRL
ncbi:MAG: hypothetical protein SFY81_09500 [Verrucomicrobiota bacterium]|nr:hypothetical protein [Verrucomicrobiota bacterium]